MARDIAALLEQMRSRPNAMRFADVCKVVDSYFGKPRMKGTSHRVWKMPWPGDPRINLQEGAGGTAKPYQVRQVLLAIDRLAALRRESESGPVRPRRRKGTK
jgi:hypothetical protein